MLLTAVQAQGWRRHLRRCIPRYTIYPAYRVTLVSWNSTEILPVHLTPIGRNGSIPRWRSAQWDLSWTHRALPVKPLWLIYVLVGFRAILDCLWLSLTWIFQLRRWHGYHMTCSWILGKRWVLKFANNILFTMDDQISLVWDRWFVSSLFFTSDLNSSSPGMNTMVVTQGEYMSLSVTCLSLIWCTSRPHTLLFTWTNWFFYYKACTCVVSLLYLPEVFTSKKINATSVNTNPNLTLPVSWIAKLLVHGLTQIHLITKLYAKIITAYFFQQKLISFTPAAKRGIM